MMSVLLRSTLREILEYESYEVDDIDNGIDGLRIHQEK
jgi:two-component system nitrogen regulation response regulator NtrX